MSVPLTSDQVHTAGRRLTLICLADAVLCASNGPVCYAQVICLVSCVIGVSLWLFQGIVIRLKRREVRQVGLPMQVPAALEALKERKEGYLAKRADVKEKGYPAAEEEEQPQSNGAGPSQPAAPAQLSPSSVQEPTPAESMGAKSASNHSGGASAGDAAAAASAGPWKAAESADAEESVGAAADAAAEEEPTEAAAEDEPAVAAVADEPADAAVADEPADAVAEEEPSQEPVAADQPPDAAADGEEPASVQPDEATPEVAHAEEADGEAADEEDAEPAEEAPTEQTPAETEPAEQAQETAVTSDTSNAAPTAAALAEPIETAEEEPADEVVSAPAPAAVPAEAEQRSDRVALALQHNDDGRVTVSLHV